MNPNLREQFDRAVSDDPGLDVAGLAHAAIAAGGRVRRRRRTMAVTGVAAGVLAAALIAGGLSLRSVATRPATQALATQAADLSMRAMTIEAAAGCQVPKAEGSLFPVLDVTEQQRTAIRAALEADSRVTDLSYESQQQAYEKFVALWKDSPDFVASVTPEQLPESFRFHLTDDSLGPAVVADYQRMAGVQDIVGFDCPATGGTK
jgi:hypothetical protein